MNLCDLGAKKSLDSFYMSLDFIYDFETFIKTTGLPVLHDAFVDEVLFRGSVC